MRCGQLSANHKQPFIEFLKQKAKILGMEKLGWQDVDAPVALGDVEPPRFTYDEACDFVIENFATFGPKIIRFCQTCIGKSLGRGRRSSE